jgi:hypothetical protein
MFHADKLDAKNVNLDDNKSSDEKHGLLYLLYDEFIHNWKIQLLVFWTMTLVYMFVGGALFRQVVLSQRAFTPANSQPLTCFGFQTD